MEATAEITVPKMGSKVPKAVKDARYSKDGKWRHFPRDSHLLQYVSTGMFYGRVKVNGKIIRRKLDTVVYTTAIVKLLDFLKEQKTALKIPVVPTLTFGQAKDSYTEEMKIDPTLSKKTVEYKQFNLKLIARTWPELDLLPLEQIRTSGVLEWSGRLAKEVSAEAYNHTLGVFKGVFRRGAKEIKRQGGALLEDPAADVKRLGVKPKKLQLPEPDQFVKLVEEIRNAGGRFSRQCSALVRFLAFSGCRLSEAKLVAWADVDWNRNEIVVNSAKHRQTSDSARIRRVPIISPMRDLLVQLKEEFPNRSDTDTVCLVFECQKALSRGCKRTSIARITHHDLRHLFATRCIEAGVDIPTVSRWLGHVDGGALAMKTYSHLRNEHSQAMAAKVKF